MEDFVYTPQDLAVFRTSRDCTYPARASRTRLCICKGLPVMIGSAFTLYYVLGAGDMICHDCSGSIVCLLDICNQPGVKVFVSINM